METQINSKNFSDNKIGISSKRNVTVYLPANYNRTADTTKRYPVIYYLHTLFEDHKTLYANYKAQELFDQAIKENVIPEVIVVSADFSTPLGGSFYTNSTVTGNWEDFTVKELVAYVDANFRTLAQAESRGLAGDRMGGYGAIRIGMRRPDVFGAVYALHPIGTGNGLQTMYSRPNWDLLVAAKSLDDLKVDGFSMVFTAIFQAHLPNPQKPPLFVDLPAQKIGARLVIDSKLTERLQNSFLLEKQIAQYADNLKRLRAFKMDWGRNDLNPDHVYSNEAFSRKLNEFGVPHEAEEYNGGWGDQHWGAQGRVYTDLLPFFNKNLVFEAKSRQSQ